MKFKKLIYFYLDQKVGKHLYYGNLLQLVQL